MANMDCMVVGIAHLLGNFEDQSPLDLRPQDISVGDITFNVLPDGYIGESEWSDDIHIVPHLIKPILFNVEMQAPEKVHVVDVRPHDDVASRQAKVEMVNKKKRCLPFKQSSSWNRDLLTEICQEVKPKLATQAKTGKKGTGEGKGKGRGKERKGKKAVGRPKGFAPVDAYENSILKSTGIFKHHKGGRTTDLSCDHARRELFVHVHGDGLFKGMWDIDSTGPTVTPQTTKLYAAFLHLIIEVGALKHYVYAPEMGHPWFPQKVGATTAYLKCITITTEQHKNLWDSVCTTRANPDNKQKTINKLIIKLGFGQEVIDGGLGKTVKFTFDPQRFRKQAPSLLKNGVGGGGGTKYKGRPLVIAAGCSA